MPLVADAMLPLCRDVYADAAMRRFHAYAMMPFFRQQPCCYAFDAAAAAYAFR